MTIRACFPSTRTGPPRATAGPTVGKASAYHISDHFPGDLGAVGSLELIFAWAGGAVVWHMLRHPQPHPSSGSEVSR